MSQISDSSSIDTKSAEYSNDSFKTASTHLSSRSEESSQKYRIRAKIKEIERESVLRQLEAKHFQLKERAELIESIIDEMVDFLMSKDNI